jgi:hypothetical protein
MGHLIDETLTRLYAFGLNLSTVRCDPLRFGVDHSIRILPEIGELSVERVTTSPLFGSVTSLRPPTYCRCCGLVVAGSEPVITSSSSSP